MLYALWIARIGHPFHDILHHPGLVQDAAHQERARIGGYAILRGHLDHHRMVVLDAELKDFGIRHSVTGKMVAQRGSPRRVVGPHAPVRRPPASATWHCEVQVLVCCSNCQNQWLPYIRLDAGFLKKSLGSAPEPWPTAAAESIFRALASRA